MTMRKVRSDTPSLSELLASDISVWGDLWLTGQPQPRSSTGIAGSSSRSTPYGWRDAIRLLWLSAGLRSTVIYRLSHRLHRLGVKVLPQILSQLNIVLHGFDVPPSVEIGHGLYVPHPVGTVVMAERIGRNLTLVSGVTIGMRNEWLFPVIGDNVYIGAGARVLGGIKVGSHVSIGANAVVISDIPDNSVAVGVPASVRPKVCISEADELGDLPSSSKKYG